LHGRIAYALHLNFRISNLFIGEHKMNRAKSIILTASLVLATTLAFSCSGDDGDGDNPSISSPSGASELCGGISYDPSVYRCDMGELIGKCRGVDYYIAYEQCVNGVVVSGATSSSNIKVNNSSSSSWNISSNSSSSLSSSSDVSSSSSVYGTFTDTRDNKIYKWVKIGDQTWMVENLNYGGPLSNPNSIGMCVGASGTSGALVSSGGRCATYGRLYNWSAAMNGAVSSTTSPSGIQGVCPSGWHLPSDAEWTTLTNHAGSNAGAKLKASSGWSSNVGTDDFGFSALPGGFGNSSGNFSGVGSDGGWWSATEDGASNAWGRDVYSNDRSVSRNNYSRSNLLSVRCVKD
jgi:uncharacterized protein (TIGR02145 family)